VSLRTDIKTMQRAGKSQREIAELLGVSRGCVRWVLDPQKVRENNRRYRAANPEKVREKTRERYRRWWMANPEKAREHHRRWREANPEKVRERNQRYREANPGYQQAYRARQIRPEQWKKIETAAVALTEKKKTAPKKSPKKRRK